MRKVLSVILAVALVCASSAYVKADTENGVSEPTLEQLAQMYISVEVITTEDEVTTVYSGLEEFFGVVRSVCPSVTDLELAWFTIDYTQCDAYNHESRALEILGAKSIMLVEQYVVMSEESGTQAYSTLDKALSANNGIAAPATEVEKNMDYGVVLLTYDVIERDTVITESGVEREYYLWTRMDWLDMPSNRWVDTLGMAYTGALDDSKDIISAVRHVGYCGSCGKSFFLQEDEDYNSLTGTYSETSSCLEFEYSSKVVSTKIAMRPFLCNHITGEIYLDYYVPTEIYAYLGFTVLISEVGEMQVAYAHSTMGVDVSLSASVAEGSVSIGLTPSLEIGYEKHIFSARTLHIT